MAGKQENIEGISATDPRGQYGGEDDSGVFRYVSIRHGGTAIGNDNELNGLSPGGVGSGTQIDHVEVFANQDDWLSGWTGLSSLGYLTPFASPGEQESAAGPVRLAVYDLLGREVAVLTEGVRSAGVHTASVDAANLPAGTYIYRLRTEQGTLTRTMTVVK